jgi:hypothetical protein
MGMRKRPAFLAAPLLAVLAVVGLGACTPASKVAEPDIVAKSRVAPGVLASCLAIELGRNFRDRRPTVGLYRGIHEITVDSPRGEKLAFVEVEADRAGGSYVRFWNGDLYWPDPTASGVWPDVMRDNWHRFEAAHKACQPAATAAKQAIRPRPAPHAKAAPVKTVTHATSLKPLKGAPLAKPGAAATPSGTAATPTGTARPGEGAEGCQCKGTMFAPSGAPRLLVP